MTKTQLFIIAIIFLSCMALGILIYSGVRSKAKKLESTNQPSPTSESAQLNYFILRVGDLGKASPSLISVWVALVFPADYSTLILKSLYPPAVPDAAASPAYNLRIGADGNPTTEFWQSFDQLPLHRNGFLLVDDVGLLALSTYITGSARAFSTPLDDPTLRNEQILTDEHLLWQEICLAIQSKSDQRGPALRWSELMPYHFRTDVGFAEIMTLWDQFSRQTDTLHCEILITP